MRPYLAIIKDSFLEAFASRVLWILLILITLVLGALAPLGFRSEQMTEFRQGDFLDPRAVAQAIRGEFDEGTPTPGYQIWSNFDEKTRQQLANFLQDNDEEGRQSTYFSDLRKFIEALNGLLAQPDLYVEEAWKDVLLGSEARELLDQGVDQLSPDSLARLNRLLIEKPYEEYFRPQPPKQIVITYLGFGVSPPIRVSEKRVQQVIAQLILPGLIGFLVGAIGILAAILVTAPIIPQMFDPGSLSLLLSKPVSRSLMFLAKFVGGCAFILINVTYLTVGLWAIVGARFDIWNHGLLLCIPIFLFLFAIYYSVSAYSGVVWRNAVVCVVMTVIFWIACKTVGITKALFEQFTVESQRIVRLIEADGVEADGVEANRTLIALDEQGTTHRWNAEKNEWEQAFLERSGGPMAQVLGPVYDVKNNQLLAATVGARRMFGSDNSLLIGKGSDGWMQVDGPALPEETFELLPDPKGRMLAVTSNGIQQLVGDVNNAPKKIQVLWMEIPQSLGKPFRSAGPETSLKLSPPSSAAVDPLSANVAIYSRGSLMLLERKGEEYALAKKIDIDTDKDQGSTLIYGGSTILLALADGSIMNYAAPTLELRRSYQPEPESQPRFACVSPDGKWFALVFHNGRLYVLDTSRDVKSEMQLAHVQGQDDISAVSFAHDNTLLVVDRAKRVSQYDPGSFRRTKTYSPALTPMEIAYYYAIVPIYTIFPKPGELGNTIQYLMRKEETIDVGMQPGNLQAKRVRLRPWAPVRSSLIFTLIVLGLACFYIERQDF